MPNKQHKPPGGPGAGGVEPKQQGALKKGQNPRPHFDWLNDQLGRWCVRQHHRPHRSTNQNARFFPPLHPTSTQPLPVIRLG